MVHAFVMVTTRPGASADVHAAVSTLDAVEAAHVVAGSYDLVVEVRGASVSEVLDAVAADVGHLDGVTETKTYVSLD
jgi:DNA-binding Lrp family transcriptional regulator